MILFVITLNLYNKSQKKFEGMFFFKICDWNVNHYSNISPEIEFAFIFSLYARRS